MSDEKLFMVNYATILEDRICMDGCNVFALFPIFTSEEEAKKYIDEHCTSATKIIPL